MSVNIIAALAGICLSILSVLSVAVVIAWKTGVWKIPIARWILALAEKKYFFDNIPEGFATLYLSGEAFSSMALSYRGFAPVNFAALREHVQKAEPPIPPELVPEDLDWTIRRVGEKEKFHEPETDGKEYVYAYTTEDFYPNKRPPWIRVIFVPKQETDQQASQKTYPGTGIVWMGLWPIIKPWTYHLRINNFRIVKPDEEEIAKKHAKLRPYYAGASTEAQEKTERAVAGWLVSWNEETTRVLLSDDSYPMPVDNVRIGVNLKGEDQQAVIANILVFIRARVQNPVLFAYRVEDPFETIQNELIQHIRKLCAGFTIKQVFDLAVTLESDKANQKNMILSENNFGEYISSRYGLKIKGASFGIVEIVGKAGDALAAPYIAKQEAEATRLRGEGEGKAEAARIRLTTKAFAKAQKTKDMNKDDVRFLRTADVAEQFAAKGSNTVLLGFNQLQQMLSNLTTPKQEPTPKQEGGKKNDPEKSKPTELP